MKKRIENWVKKLDTLVGWIIIFMSSLHVLSLHSIFTDFTNATLYISYF